MSGILNISTLTNVENLVGQTLSQAIVRPTGGIASIGVSGFLFDIVGVEEITSEADITDHFIEDNTAIQDQMALRPVRFSLQGFTGELNDDLEQALAQLFSAVTGISFVNELLPGFALGAQQTYSAIQTAINNVNGAVSQANSLFGVFSTFSTMANKQQMAYNAFLAMQQSRQFCSVDTPYGTFQNMLIESICARQNEHTLIVSEFRVTLKQVRVVSTVVSSALVSSLGRAANAYSEVSNNGIAQGTETNNGQIGTDFPTLTIDPNAYKRNETNN